ncbi:cell division ATP-binding protein FtsE [bacterium]|nr:MAG: cell division ATP-binding protein FtsE [bacterium]
MVQATESSSNEARRGPAGEARPVISLFHASLRYGHFLALDDVSFKIENGEFVFIVGPSGAGKSSILRLVLMHEQPTEGEVQVGRFLSSKVRRREIPLVRREVGCVFQDFRLMRDRSVEENVAFAQMVVGVSRAQTKKNVVQVLNWVGLYHKRHQTARTLSGGEQQRVAIARAIVNRPKILLADEPTGNLDPEVSQEVLDLLFRINAQGTSVIMSTHDHLMVRRFGERVIKLDQGRVAADLERYRPQASDERRQIESMRGPSAGVGMKERSVQSWLQSPDRENHHA